MLNLAIEGNICSQEYIKVCSYDVPASRLEEWQNVCFSALQMCTPIHFNAFVVILEIHRDSREAKGTVLERV